MKKSTIALLATLGLILALALALVLAGALTLRSRLEGAGHGAPGGRLSGGPRQAESTTDVRGVRRVDVSNVSGLIQVDGWTNDFVRFHYSKEARSDEALERVKVRHSVDGDTLTITVDYPRGDSDAYGPVHIDLSLPSEVTELRARSVAGGLVVAGLGSRVSQELETVSGAISTDGAWNLRAASVSGAIRFAAEGREIRAHTASGSIAGRLTSLEPGGSVELGSLSGSIDLQAFPGLQAQVDLGSASGIVTCRFPVVITEKKDNALQGRIGDGSGEVRLKSMAGRVELAPI